LFLFDVREPLRQTGESGSGRAAKHCGCVIKNIIAGTVGDSIGRLEPTFCPPPPRDLLLAPLLLMVSLTNRSVLMVLEDALVTPSRGP
jgi:hypothetical protein